MTTITFGDLSFELRHSAKRRTIGITVERDGQLILASPPEVPMETLEKVVRDKRLWIYSKLLKKESLNPPTAVKEYVSGEGFYYLGLPRMQLSPQTGGWCERTATSETLPKPL
jgi:predicted metal-dependent hydrolase